MYLELPDNLTLSKCIVLLSVEVMVIESEQLLYRGTIKLSGSMTGSYASMLTIDLMLSEANI